MDLKLGHYNKDGIEVVDVEGEIDVYTAPRLRELLIDLVNKSNYQLVVNMEKVEFLDSTGLGVLVGGLKRVRAHDGSLDLVCTQERMMQAERGLQELLESVDTVIVIPNEKLLAVAKDAGFFESFRIADDVLRQGVQGISDIITIPGVINRDFADVKTTMAGMGYAVMGTGVRTGTNRAVEAAMAAMASPLLEAGAIDGARGILINITGSSSLKLTEVNEASTIIQNAAHEDANIIFGAVQDESMGDEVKITVIATGFKHQEMPLRRERMLAESVLPTVRYDVPIQPRVVTPRPGSRFASEMECQPVGTPNAEAKPASGKVEAQAELIPVPASVFDDDFFRAGEKEGKTLDTEEMDREVYDRYSETVHLPDPKFVQKEDVSGVREELSVVEATGRPASFGGAVTASTEIGEPDELDIPAFLRRGR